MSLLTNPARRVVEITPDDSNDLPGGLCRGVYVGVSGNLAFVDEEGNDSDLPNVVAGMDYAVRMQKVYATGTTASSLRALY